MQLLYCLDDVLSTKHVHFEKFFGWHQKLDSSSSNHDLNVSFHDLGIIKGLVIGHLLSVIYCKINKLIY